MARLERKVRRHIRMAEWTAVMMRRLLWLLSGKTEPPGKWLFPGAERLPIETESPPSLADLDPPGKAS